MGFFGHIPPSKNIVKIEPMPIQKPDASLFLLSFYNSVNCKLNGLDGDKATIDAVKKILDGEMALIVRPLAAPRYTLNIGDKDNE